MVLKNYETRILASKWLAIYGTKRLRLRELDLAFSVGSCVCNCAQYATDTRIYTSERDWPDETHPFSHTKLAICSNGNIFAQNDIYRLVCVRFSGHCPLWHLSRQCRRNSILKARFFLLLKTRKSWESEMKRHITWFGTLSAFEG